MKASKFFSLGIVTLSLVLASCGSTKNKSSSQPINNSNSSGQVSSNINSSNNGGNKSSFGSSSQSASSSSSSSSSQPSEKVEKTIGSAGGEVKDESSGLDVSIPAGALDNDTNITAQYFNSPEILSDDISSNDFLGAVEFGPDGTTFNEPVTVTINLAKTPKNSELSVFCYYEEEDIWEYVTDATPNGNKATFEVTHFSKYQVKDRTKDFLNEYTNIVRHAKANGLSDAEITEEFRDYLVYEKHVMDQYTTYNGYWYEPCGLKISGSYQINGQEGDPNALIKHEGESNKVGEKYGLCEIDGATSSREAEKNANQTSEIIDVLVIVEYSIIKPDIELTASKKKLSRDETATINIRCHYTNVNNFYPEYKDLALSGYMLTISRPTNFRVNKTSVLTSGSGRESFTVTALENNKAETITVSFDVSGDFGTHAEGNITLNTVGITISGHISEEMDIVWRAPIETLEGSWSVAETGSFNLKVEYDFDGVIEEQEEGPLTGSLQFTNVSASFTSTPCTIRGRVGEATGYGTYDFFSSVSNNIPASPIFDFVGSINNDVCSIFSEGDCDQIVSILGPGNTHIYVTAGGIIDDEEDVDNSYTFTVNGSEESLLLDFVLVAGTETYTSSSFKDQFVGSFSVEGFGMEFNDLTDLNMVIISETKTTTQTITVLL